MKKRKQYSAAFKLKAVLEMLKEERTIPEIASELEVHPTMLHAWRREFFEKAPAIFEDKRKRTESQDAEAMTGQLYQQIGQLANGKEKMYQRGGVKVYHFLRRSNFDPPGGLKCLQSSS